MTIGSIGDQVYTGGVAGPYGLDAEQTRVAGAKGQNVGMVPPANVSGVDTEQKAALNPPSGSYTSASLSSANGACASFFGSVLAMIQEMASDLVRDNRQIAYDSQMMAADSMESQADKMRDKAVVSLVTGVIQGALQIAGGAVQFGMSVKGLSDISKMSNSAKAADAASDAATDTAKAASKSKDNLLTRAFNALRDPQSGKMAGDYLQNLNNLGMAVGQMSQGIGGLTGGVGSYLTTMMDAEIKEMEADQKRMEAFADQLKSINESFRQTVQSAIETSRTISQSMVETNKRILA